MADIAVAFLWHQHQPYYPDDVGGDNPMPWVRMHGVKDYYGMPLHLLAVPDMRVTINLVPSLITQILAYTEHGASDRFLDVARIPADSLSEADALFLLDHYFMANHDHLIKPHARYGELLHKRNPGRATARDVLRRFNEKDFRDLQVWFNLAWIHRLAIDRHAGLRELINKGRTFTEADKEHVLKTHLDILRQLIPLHRQLAESGQVELTTTPFYHPILPLLIDKKLARESMPQVVLPRAQGGYPDDAALHVRRAIESHTKHFGKPPVGMWPAEGSVCQPMVPLLAQHGIRWIATDEEILNASTHGFVSRDSKGGIRNPERMYRAYKVEEAGQEISIVFRDHVLSDLIGFHYQRSEPVAAADDFIRHIRDIQAAVEPSGEPALVSVILDGENCWEHYPEGGVTFLRTLYERCARTAGIHPVTIGGHLEQRPARDLLPHLFAGSWISHDFHIWIGQEEDNAGWDALDATRRHLRHRSAAWLVRHGALANEESSKPLDFSALPDNYRRAWEEIYIAEGSDWFWWYGDDHSSALDHVFDSLFRKHLQNVYLLIGDPPPLELSRPISRKAHKTLHTAPRSFLDVKVDGRMTFFEWLNAGHYTSQNERGTMAQVTSGIMQELYFGFNVSALLVRVDFEAAAKTVLPDFDLVRLAFAEPGGFEVQVVPERQGRPFSLRFLEQGKEIDAPDVKAAIDQIVEISVPFTRLGVKVDQPVSFFVELFQVEQSRDRAPREGTINLKCPSPDFEQIMWNV